MPESADPPSMQPTAAEFESWLGLSVRDATEFAYRYHHHAVGPKEAGDLAQETFVRLLVAYKAGKPVRSPVPFLSTVAKNVRMDFFRAQYRRPKVVELAVDHADEAEGPEEAAVRTDTASYLRRTIDRLAASGRLSREQHEYLAMYLRGLPEKQIATQWNVSLGTVKSRGASARAAIRAALSTAEIEETGND